MPVTEVCDGMEQHIVLHPLGYMQMPVAEICDGVEQQIVLHPPGYA